MNGRFFWGSYWWLPSSGNLSRLSRPEFKPRFPSITAVEPDPSPVSSSYRMGPMLRSQESIRHYRHNTWDRHDDGSENGPSYEKCATSIFDVTSPSWFWNHCEEFKKTQIKSNGTDGRGPQYIWRWKRHYTVLRIHPNHSTRRKFNASNFCYWGIGETHDRAWWEKSSARDPFTIFLRSMVGAALGNPLVA